MISMVYFWFCGVSKFIILSYQLIKWNISTVFDLHDSLLYHLDRFFKNFLKYFNMIFYLGNSSLNFFWCYFKTKYCNLKVVICWKHFKFISVICYHVLFTRSNVASIEKLILYILLQLVVLYLQGLLKIMIFCWLEVIATNCLKISGTIGIMSERYCYSLF